MSEKINDKQRTRLRVSCACVYLHGPCRSPPHLFEKRVGFRVEVSGVVDGLRLRNRPCCGDREWLEGTAGVADREKALK